MRDFDAKSAFVEELLDPLLSLLKNEEPHSGTDQRVQRKALGGLKSPTPAESLLGRRHFSRSLASSNEEALLSEKRRPLCRPRNPRLEGLLAGLAGVLSASVEEPSAPLEQSLGGRERRVQTHNHQRAQPSAKENPRHRLARAGLAWKEVFNGERKVWRKGFPGLFLSSHGGAGMGLLRSSRLLGRIFIEIP